MAKPMTIAFFDAKSYDHESFDPVNGEAFRFDIRYFQNRLTPYSLPARGDWSTRKPSPVALGPCDEKNN